MSVARERTQVAIIGAGPAGLLLGHLLTQAGVENVVLEARDRAYVEHRVRAGVLEQPTVDVLRACRVGERLDREGLRHTGVELQFDGVRHRLALDELTGGDAITVYGQQEVVKDLIAARTGPLEFSVSDVRVEGFDGDEPIVRYVREGGAAVELACDLIAGCDGFHGITRGAVADALTVYERVYPFAWLGVLAEVAPSSEELIYCRSDRGFALHSMRSPEVTRLYLQVPPDETLDGWSDDRIWTELSERLHVRDGSWELQDGPIFDKGVTPMRSFVAEPMRHGRLVLAGDAAHIVPPTGAKGMNLAVHDVVILARAAEAALQRGDSAGLDAYSETCLRRVWRAQHFSWWMTSMFHNPPEQDPFESQLQRSQLHWVTSTRTGGAALAENYVGLPHG